MDLSALRERFKPRVCDVTGHPNNGPFLNVRIDGAFLIVFGYIFHDKQLAN